MLGIAVAVAAFEMAAAARLVHWELFYMWLRGEEQHYVGDSELGFRHAANTRWSGRLRADVENGCGLPTSMADPITITHDANGYRNVTHFTQADIVLIGDSYVEGRYVSDDQTVASFLQERLGLTVANLGVAGYGAAQELIVLQRDGMRLKPEVVIWFFFEGNDLYNDHAFENTLLSSPEMRTGGLTDSHGWWRRSFVRNTHAQLRLLFHPLVPSQCPHAAVLAVGSHRGKTVLFGPEAAYPWTDFERRRWESARKTLGEAVKITRERNANFLLVYVPIKFRVYRDFIDLPAGSELREWTLWPLPDLFGQFCRGEGLTCLDLTELLRGSVRKGGMPYAPADTHWSAEGHRLIAEALQEMLESRGWIPAGGAAARMRSEK
jgi:lysophospholipase L1-like esterase